jgi:tellurite resistance protein TerA
MVELTQGANAPVAGTALTVSVDWPAVGGADADITAYLLTDAGTVRGDADMVFYNNATGGDGAIRYAAGTSPRGRFDVDLARMPAAIARVVFCVTVEDAAARRQTMAALAGATIRVGDIAYAPALAGATEAAMILGEVYLRGGQWKFRAVGQGFNGGLAPLARSFGIEVADDAPAPPPPPPTAKPISLSKVSLDKPRQTVSLEKRGTTFGEIVVNLNWSRCTAKKGLFGGGSGAIDLDLGCLLELSDGQKGVVQALGRSFGSYDDAPFVALSGDDRTGDVSAGETMRINGGEWTYIKRVAVFANIYDGVPNWAQTDGVVTVTMPDQPPIEVRMTEGRNDKRLCGVVLLENDGGAIKVTRIVDYYRDQSELDRAFGFGLRWAAGRKD